MTNTRGVWLMERAGCRERQEMAAISDVRRAKDLDDLLRRMSQMADRPRILAGGTDLLLHRADVREESVTLIDVTHVAALKGIHEEPDGIRIGAAVSLSAVMRSDIIRDRLGVLADGAGAVAGPPIRNLATLGGNVCNASPSADMVPPLLVLDAQAELQSAEGRRTVPLDEFFVSPGETALDDGEVLVSFLVPSPEPGTVASYTKISPRRAMDLAVVGVAVAMSNANRGFRVRIALGAVGPTPLRAEEAEDYLRTVARMDASTAAEAGRLAEKATSPIDDIRGSARYRRAVVQRIVARNLLRGHERLEREAVS